MELFVEPPVRALVKDSVYLDPKAMAECAHPRMRSFTFKDESEIHLCPDCGFERGQAVLRTVPRR